jgi:hypothetical protein
MAAAVCLNLRGAVSDSTIDKLILTQALIEGPFV